MGVLVVSLVLVLVNVLCDMCCEFQRSMFDSTAGFIPLHDVFEPLKTVLAWQFPIFLLATS